MNILAVILALANTVITPIYVNHNKVKGDVPVMTNMSAWADSIRGHIPGNYAAVSNNAMTAVQQEVDPSVGITNGTVYIHGSHITPVVDPYYQEVTNAIYEYLGPAYEISSILLKEPIEWKLRPLSFVYPKGTVVYSAGTNNTAYWYAPIAIQGNIRPAAESSWVEIARPGWGLSSSSHAFDYLFDKIAAQTPGNYAAVSNAAMTAVQPETLDNYLPTSWAEESSSEFAGTAAMANYAGGAQYLSGQYQLREDEYYHRWGAEGVDEEGVIKLFAYIDEVPTAETLRAVTYAEGASEDHKTAAGILAVAERGAETKIDAVLDYALTNLTGATVTLASGQIGNVTLDNVTSNLTLNLDFAAATDRSGDCMLYLINAADTYLAVGPASDVTPIGYKASDAMKAGTNLVMVTRLVFDSGKSVVNVAIKEVK